jgi:phospholipase D1/2
VDSEVSRKGHITYRIELQYGEGPTQMHWTIQREHRDFQALHNRLRLLYLGKRDKLPEFPHSTIPFWLGNFGAGKDIDKVDIKKRIPQQLGPGVVAGVGALAGAIGGGVPDMKKKDVQLAARTKLQEYLTQLAFFLVFLLGVGLI